MSATIPKRRSPAAPAAGAPSAFDYECPFCDGAKAMGPYCRAPAPFPSESGD
jgi:hypothetical protein